MNYFPFSNYWKENERYNFILHEHDAEKAGKHYDLRIEIETPKNYISSFASRYFLKLLLKKEKKVLIIPQNLHHKDWLSIKNTEIKRGYGKGTIKMVIKGNIYIFSVKENSMKFLLYVNECGKETINIRQCKVLIEKPTPIAFINFGKNVLAIRGRN